MTIDIHKVITGNPMTKNLMKPWAVNAKKGLLGVKCLEITLVREIAVMIVKTV